MIQAGDGPERTTTKTDASGRFRLGGFRPGPSLISAHAEGFRVQRRGSSSMGENAIVLTRTTERPERSLTLLLPPIPRDEILGIARTVLAPGLDTAMKADVENDKFGVLDSLSAIDPAEGLRLMKSSGYKPRTVLPGKIAKRFAARGDMAGAESALAECDSPDYRGQAMLELADALDADRIDEKLKLIRRARAVLGELSAPADQVDLIGEIGERLLELGRWAEARAMFASGQRIAENLAANAPSRAPFAARLAAVDLPAALKLIEAIPNPQQRSSAIGNAAMRLAATRPKECERLLMEYHIIPSIQVVDRMAAVDPERALRLAKVSDDARTDALLSLVVAHGLAKTNRPAASRLCQDVIASLAARPVDAVDMGYMDAYHATIVEEIDPSLVAEYLWIGISRRSGSIESSQIGVFDTVSCHLAAIVARYDHTRSPPPYWQGRRPASTSSAWAKPVPTRAW